jgi:hypothetical protein
MDPTLEQLNRHLNDHDDHMAADGLTPEWAENWTNDWLDSMDAALDAATD